MDPNTLIERFTEWDPRQDLRLQDVLERPLVGLGLQTLLTGLAIATIFGVLSALRQAVVATSLASTAFTVFLIPHARVARSRAVFWSHMLAIPPGWGAGVLLDGGPLITALSLGVAVSVAGLLMEAMAAPHPPAAGTALGLAIAPELGLVLSVLAGAVVLAALHALLAPRMLDLREVPEIGIVSVERTPQDRT